ncbi:MAG: hypothetical protein HC890_02295 [Chloroflexaceae bacterium]|nr:hypothetical protein [Chloroflexaceae bacterium]
MINPSLENQIRYVTNAAGETTDVLIPLNLWQQIVGALRDSDSGLAWIDEHEPNAQLLTDPKTSFQQTPSGETFPVSQLWDD